MSGLDGHRVYLDWNATAPLRSEARAAMLAAMDVVGNPSSVHAEGRAARAIVETARTQVAALVDCDPSEVVFTSGATEAAAMVLRGADASLSASGVEHDCVRAWVREDLVADANGAVRVARAQGSVLQAACGETGVVQDLPPGLHFTDATQAVGKTAFSFRNSGAQSAALSAHKLGGPKGVGAAIVGAPLTLDPMIIGGGQEHGRRSGTENVIGIAGFGAAAAAAIRDREDGVWHRVAEIRNILESALAEASEETIFFGRESVRLPNTSCFSVLGWRGETQVMQMDLAGFAISAGSACSSGKVNRASHALRAMGYDNTVASSAIRVSMGPTTTEAEVMAFAAAWADRYKRRSGRAA